MGRRRRRHIDEPVRSFRDLFPQLWIALLFGGGLVVVAFQLGIQDMYGIRIGWDWALVNSGRLETRALTPKIVDIDTHHIFLVEGEELEVDVDWRLERGTGGVAILHTGWPWQLAFVETLTRTGRFSTPHRETMRVTAPASGFYSVDGRIQSATGTFVYEWRVRNPRPAGRVGRGVRVLFFSLGGILLLVGVTGALVFTFRR